MKSWHRISIWLLAGVLFSSGCQLATSTPTTSPIRATVTVAASAGPSATPFVNAELTPTDTTFETRAPTSIPTVTEAPPTSTPSGLQMPEHTLLLAYNPPGKEVLSDVWLLRPPYQQVVPFREHDTSYAYCCPVWSPTGQQFAYVRTSVTTSVSSLWVSQFSESTPFQVGTEIQRGSLPSGLQAITPLGWSSDNNKTLFFKGDELYIIDVQTGENELIDFSSGLSSAVTVPLHFVQYNPTADEIVMYGQDKKTARLVLFIEAIRDLGHVVALNPPDDYSPVGQGGFDFLPAEVSLSPDGHFFLASDFERHSVKERLWLIDVVNNEWKLLISRPAEYLPNSVAWSSDQRWAAWWRMDKDLQGNYSVFITFLDTASWNITRDYKFSGTPSFVRDGIIGWTTDSQGNSAFAILENKPGRGIVLLKPDGSENDDLELVGYDQLAQQLPFKPEDAEWVWQP